MSTSCIYPASMSNYSPQCLQCTDPLQPVYDVNGARIADDPIKSRPRKLPKKKNCPYYSLVTQDIEVSSH